MMRYRVDTLNPAKEAIETKSPELKPRVLDCQLKDNFFDEGDCRGRDN